MANETTNETTTNETTSETTTTNEPTPVLSSVNLAPEGTEPARTLRGFISEATLTVREGKRSVHFAGAGGAKVPAVRFDNRTEPAASANISGDEAAAFLAAIGAGGDDKSAKVALASWSALALADARAHRMTRITFAPAADAKVVPLTADDLAALLA